jgi:N-hydroxyarylamine O-acetyltransferase
VATLDALKRTSVPTPSPVGSLVKSTTSKVAILFDLQSYLTRIRITEALSPDVESLADVHFAHRQAIPFENADVMLGREVHIDSASTFDKLVTRHRGGYCFEQNRLFLDALDAIGFEARTLLARVWLGATDTPPLTHSLVLVTIDGTHWIADAGFGGSFAPPMKLRDGSRVTAPDGATFELVRRGSADWLLRRSSQASNGEDATASGQAQYSFDLRDVHDADLTIANHWTSVSPDSLFRRQFFVNAVLPDGFASVTDRKMQETVEGQRRTALISTPDSYRKLLRDRFGLELDMTEVEGLGLFPPKDL